MTNLDKYVEVFCDFLHIEKHEIDESIAYRSRKEWDSIGHIELVQKIEKTFGVTFLSDDIFDFTSFESGKNVLLKYAIDMMGAYHDLNI